MKDHEVEELLRQAQKLRAKNPDDKKIVEIVNQSEIDIFSGRMSPDVLIKLLTEHK